MQGETGEKASFAPPARSRAAQSQSEPMTPAEPPCSAILPVSVEASFVILRSRPDSWSSL